MSDNFNAKHPDSIFTSQYPYNQATITRSGHEIHINDTPGSESLKISHRMGTYIEIDSSGKWNQTVADKAYNYYKDGFSETIDGHKDVKVNGSYDLNVDGSIHEQTAGNRYSGIGGNHTVGVAGTQYTHTGLNKEESIDGFNIRSVLFDEHADITGDQVTHVGGVKTDIIGRGWSSKTGIGGVEIQSTGIVNITCSAFNVITPFGTLSIGPTGITLNGALISFTSLGPASITAATTVNVTGPAGVNINQYV